MLNVERRHIPFYHDGTEENYRSMFYLSPIPMWVFDNVTYQFLNVNEAAIQHYGYSKEEFLSMTLRDIRPVEDIPLLEEMVRNTLSSGLTHQGVIRHCNKKGEIMQVEVQSTAIEFEGKKARLVLAHNVTERMNYLQAIEEKNQKLQEIAWIQSHVVRAPLARIMGLVDFLNDQASHDSETADILNHIVLSAKELDEVIRTIVAKTEQVEKY